MTEEFAWEDPPDSAYGHRKGQTIWQRRLAPCVEHPKRWARVYTSPYAAVPASQLKNGRLLIPVGTTPDQWEFVTRKVDGTRVLYARFLGDATA